MTAYPLDGRLPALLAVLIFVTANHAANHWSGIYRSRFAYALIVVLFFGTVVPAFAIRGLAGQDASTAFAISWTALLVGFGAGLAWLTLSLRGVRDAAWAYVARVAVGLFGPSLAEVLVFIGLVLPLANGFFADHLATPLAACAAYAVSALAFGFYHFTHAPPWNTWRFAAFLSGVWLVVGAVFLITQNIWATALFNTLLATVGFVRFRVSSLDRTSAPAGFTLDVFGIAAVVAIVIGIPPAFR